MLCSLHSVCPIVHVTVNRELTHEESVSCVYASNRSLPVVAQQPNINHQNAFEINVNGWERRRKKKKFKSNRTHITVVCLSEWVSEWTLLLVDSFLYLRFGIRRFMRRTATAQHMWNALCHHLVRTIVDIVFLAFDGPKSQVREQWPIATWSTRVCVLLRYKKNMSARTRHSISDCPRHRPVHMDSIISLVPTQ